MVDNDGFEPSLRVCRTHVLPLTLIAQTKNGRGTQIRTEVLTVPSGADCQTFPYPDSMVPLRGIEPRSVV